MYGVGSLGLLASSLLLVDLGFDCRNLLKKYLASTEIGQLREVLSKGGGCFQVGCTAEVV